MITICPSTWPVPCNPLAERGGKRAPADPPLRSPITGTARCLDLVTERGSIRKVEAAPGRPDGGHVAAGDPDGFGTGEEFLRRPLDGSPGAKIKFKLGGTFQIFNPTFGVCVEPHGGAPRQTVGLLR
jgi:hypothetical protein